MQKPDARKCLTNAHKTMLDSAIKLMEVKFDLMANLHSDLCFQVLCELEEGVTKLIKAIHMSKPPRKGA